MQTQEIIPHLFRTEFRKITAVLCQQVGLAHVELAEDIAGETFLSALETWPYKGMPQNPSAWLYAVAKNKLKNHLNRDAVFREKVLPSLCNAKPSYEAAEPDWSEENILDSQLAMLFAVCHPLLSFESQIALALRLLCGFGVEEIATAFFTNKETINKRLYRAKETLRRNKVSLEVPTAAETGNRLPAVLKTLYLLFSEGYYSESSDTILRKDLCAEAMHLTSLLLQHPATNEPQTAALLSLMCFQASRFNARTAENGQLVLYAEQDEADWNQELIAKGILFLHQAATGNKLSSYHLEAAIAYWYTVKKETPEKWEAILQLYDQLLQINPTPVAALNRIYALSKVKGCATAIKEAETLPLAGNRFYHSLLGHLYKETDPSKAIVHLQQARAQTKSAAEKQLLQQQLSKLMAVKK